MASSKVGVFSRAGVCSFGLAAAPLLAQTASPAPARGDVVQLEGVVTIGSRFSDRTVIDSPVPIDLFTKEEVQGGGYTELPQVMSVLVPSLDFPRPTNTDGTDHVRP